MEWLLAVVPIVGSIALLGWAVVKVSADQRSRPSARVEVGSRESRSPDLANVVAELQAEIRFQKSLYLRVRSDVAQNDRRLSEVADVLLARVDRNAREVGQLDEDLKYLKAEVAELFALSDRVSRILSSVESVDMYMKDAE